MDPSEAAEQARPLLAEHPDVQTAIREHTFEELQIGIGLSPQMRELAGAAALNDLPEQVIDFWRANPRWLYDFREALIGNA